MAFDASTGAPVLALRRIAFDENRRASATRCALLRLLPGSIIRTAIPAITKNIFDRKNGP
jgi:hypothetical protein